MTINVEPGLVALSGRCAAEDAERLLSALQEEPDCLVDLSAATRLHTAVIQIIVAIRPKLRGVPSDPFLCEFILPGLTIG